MRTYYGFEIKESLVHFYKKKPNSLYKMLEQIYNFQSDDIVLGYKMLEQITVKFDKKGLNDYIFKTHSHELSYLKSDGAHVTKNLYSNELTVLRIFNSHLKIKSNVDCPSFFYSVSQLNRNIFICDFTNKDYFWIQEINKKVVV